jgi:hypothetical protein
MPASAISSQMLAIDHQAVAPDDHSCFVEKILSIARMTMSSTA